MTIFVLMASAAEEGVRQLRAEDRRRLGLGGDGLGDRADRVLVHRSRCCPRPLRTWKRPKKNGDCARIGRHEEKGLVPSFLYSSIVSAVIAWRDSGSLLPLYFFWIFCSSGWIICILREAMICLKNSGIIAARITRTRPTIDSAQVHPDAAGSPMWSSPAWKPYMIHATSHSIGAMIVLKKSPMLSLRLCRSAPAKWCHGRDGGQVGCDSARGAAGSASWSGSSGMPRGPVVPGIGRPVAGSRRGTWSTPPGAHGWQRPDPAHRHPGSAQRAVLARGRSRRRRSRTGSSGRSAGASAR